MLADAVMREGSLAASTSQWLAMGRGASG